MLSTGVEPLDARLGGIEEGGRAVVMGPDGAGKSVLGLHFVLEGIQNGERCLLITAGGAAAVDSRGAYLGYSPGPLSNSPLLRVVDSHRTGDPHAILHQRSPVDVLGRLLREGDYARIVIDDLQELLRGVTSPAKLLRELDRVLADSPGTSYVLISSDVKRSFWSGYLEPLTREASVVIRLDPSGRGRRKFSFRAVRQGAFSTEPFLYTLRTGGGFSEDLPAYEREVDREHRSRVAVLDQGGIIPEEVTEALSEFFEVQVYRNLDRSLRDLLDAHYGVLIQAVDPYDPERAFDLTYTLRRSGSGAPIVFVSPSKGLRSMTRSRGLRIGGDDFIIAELPAPEIIDRIRRVAEDGVHRDGREESGEPHARQPRSERGEYRPMDEWELRQALATLSDQTPAPFFVLAVLRTPSTTDGQELWNAAQLQLRLADGDLVAALDSGDLALVLKHVDGGLGQKILDRLRTHPTLEATQVSLLLSSPLEGDEIRLWSSAGAEEPR